MNVHHLTDFPVSMIYSFFIIEATSQGIETELWRKHANAGGVKALKGYESVTYKTREVIRGKDKYIKAKFMKAETTEEGMNLWAQVLNSGRYYECKKANYKLKGKRLYESICKCIYENGYHTDRDYKFRASLMAEYWEIKTNNFPLKKEYNVF
jgi:flagellum-specific peptidoglycan hydrolase FlgJ